MPTARSLAMAAILLLVAYFAVDNHVSLRPWNSLDAAGPQLTSTLVGVIPFALVLIALWLQSRWALAVGTVWALIWFLLQLRQWWVPYLFGRTSLHSDFAWYFDHGYSETFRVLPVIAGRPVPDAQHMVLQMLSLLVLITLAKALFAVPKAQSPISRTQL